MTPARITLLFLVVFGVSTVWTQTCYQDLLQCKSQAIASSLDACRVLDNWLNCLSGKGSSCSLEETNGVSFQAVKDVAKDECPAFATALGTGLCRQLVLCLSNDTQSKYISLINTNTYTNETVKTGFWCSLMSDAVNCAITHAADCALTKDTTTALSKSRDNTQRVCQNKGGAGSMQEGTLTVVLALLAVALLQKMIF